MKKLILFLVASVILLSFTMIQAGKDSTKAKKEQVSATQTNAANHKGLAMEDRHQWD